MNITVAKRIIGGFTAISVLLFLISITSWFSLSKINSASDEVIDLAIPTLVQSNQLKILLSQISTITYQGYYEQDLASLEKQKKKFEEYKASFSTELDSLKRVVASEQGLRAASNKLDELYQPYFGHVESIFNDKDTILSITTRLEEQLMEIEDDVDNTSTLILDFNYSDAAQNNASLKAAATAGESLDNSLMSVVTASDAFTKTRDTARAETLGNEVKLLIERIVEEGNEMQAKSQGKDSSGAISEVQENINSLEDKLKGPTGLIANHNQRIARMDSARASLEKALVAMQSTTEQLNTVLSLGDAKADAKKADVASSVSSGRWSIGIITLISVAVAVGVAFLTVRAITIPLQKVNDMLNIVATGDLTRKLDDKSKDEFGDLARNCNALIDSLKDLISGISNGATQLAAAAEETSSVTTQATRSIQEQKSQVAQVATATTELNSTAQLVANSAEDTLAQIGNANVEAETVKRISEDNKNTIMVLAQDVESAANVINKVQQDSASIGGILDVIRGIADQTNLLALNAAIEAARAGEQGRGFAVVADEVRTLASRTQESTQEIQSMIEVLQAGAEQAVSVMQKGKEQTNLCVVQAEKAAEALNSITSAVHRAHDVSTQIEQAAKEQHTVSRDISEKLENIVNIAEETAAGAQHTSRASQEVAGLAEELQSSVRKFQV